MSNESDDGGQAFPCYVNGIGWDTGMSLRDYFAAAALQGMLAGGELYKDIAAEAYYYADAMLEARKNKT